MTKKYIVGGPQGAGKSTMVLSLVESIKEAGGTAVALELDQWSDSYRMIRGEITDTERVKRYDLQSWPWKERVQPLLDHFMHGTEDVIFGDLPGVLGAANAYMLEKIASAADGAIIIARDVEGLKLWRRLFVKDYGLGVVRELLSLQSCIPTILPDMKRVIEPENPVIAQFAAELFMP